MYDAKDIIKNVEDMYLTDSALDTLMDFERVLDNVNLYAFKNWLQGELVAGPIYEKYFVTCKFMWLDGEMPDPSGGERLLDYGCKISYEKGTLRVPLKVESYDDFRQGTRVAKLDEMKIWIVEIIMPRDLIKDIKQGSIEIEGEDVDAQELSQAYDEGDIEQENQDTEEEDELEDEELDDLTL